MNGHAARAWLTCLALGGLGAGCGSAPPDELAGLWSAGAAACDAGVGVRFGARAIEAVYEGRRETLFAAPTYRRLGSERAFRVRIDYALPHRPGGAHSAGARGVIVLERGEDGFLKPSAHNLLDERTGSARVRIGRDPALTALALAPCAPGHPWREALRGRGAS